MQAAGLAHTCLLVCRLLPASATLLASPLPKRTSRPNLRCRPAPAPPLLLFFHRPLPPVLCKASFRIATALTCFLRSPLCFFGISTSNRHLAKLPNAAAA